MPDRWIDQTSFYDPSIRANGNCTEAAVASLLGIGLDDVPRFRDAGPGPEDFWDAFDAFFAGRGLEVVCLPGNHAPDCLYLASGKASRGCSHMVVMRGGKLAHDPHPSREGVAQIDRVWLVVPRDLAA